MCLERLYALFTYVLQWMNVSHFPILTVKMHLNMFWQTKACDTFLEVCKIKRRFFEISDSPLNEIAAFQIKQF